MSTNREQFLKLISERQFNKDTRHLSPSKSAEPIRTITDSDKRETYLMKFINRQAIGKTEYCDRDLHRQISSIDAIPLIYLRDIFRSKHPLKIEIYEDDRQTSTETSSDYTITQIGKMHFIIATTFEQKKQFLFDSIMYNFPLYTSNGINCGNANITHFSISTMYNLYNDDDTIFFTIVTK